MIVILTGVFTISVLQFVIIPNINKNFKLKATHRKDSNNNDGINDGGNSATIYEKENETMTVMSFIPFVLFISSGSLVNFSFCFFVSILVVPIYSPLLSPLIDVTSSNIESISAARNKVRSAL